MKMSSNLDYQYQKTTIMNVSGIRSRAKSTIDNNFSYQNDPLSLDASDDMKETQENIASNTDNTENNDDSSTKLTCNNDSATTLKPKRKKVAEPQEWKRNKNRQLRLEGKEYIGYNRPNKGKITHNVPRAARSVQPRCDSTYCDKSKTRQCSSLTNINRQEIFDMFWSMTWEQRKVFVASHVSVEAIKRKTGKGPSRRSASHNYFLTAKHTRYQVCRKMFLNTLHVGEWCVKEWISKSSCGMIINKPTTKRKGKVPPGDMSTLFTFLQKLPFESTKKKSGKRYLTSCIKSKSVVFNNYIDYCTVNNIEKASRRSFDAKWQEMRIHLWQDKPIVANKRKQKSPKKAVEQFELSDEAIKHYQYEHNISPPVNSTSAIINQHIIYQNPTESLYQYHSPPDQRLHNMMDSQIKIFTVQPNHSYNNS